MGVASMTGWGRAPLQETISSVATEPPTAKKEIKIQGRKTAWGTIETRSGDRKPEAKPSL